MRPARGRDQERRRRGGHRCRAPTPRRAADRVAPNRGPARRGRAPTGGHALAAEGSPLGGPRRRGGGPSARRRRPRPRFRCTATRPCRSAVDSSGREPHRLDERHRQRLADGQELHQPPFLSRCSPRRSAMSSLQTVAARQRAGPAPPLIVLHEHALGPRPLAPPRARRAAPLASMPTPAAAPRVRRRPTLPPGVTRSRPRRGPADRRGRPAPPSTARPPRPGSGSPDRTVATTEARALVARWRTSAADPSSRRCASSTTTTVRGWSPISAALSDVRSCRRSGPAPSSATSMSGTHGAKAPKGMVAVARVARTVAVAMPASAIRSSSSVTSRDLPTPAAPATTQEEESSITDAARSSSSSIRPTSGHRASAARGDGSAERDSARAGARALCVTADQVSPRRPGSSSWCRPPTARGCGCSVSGTSTPTNGMAGSWYDRLSSNTGWAPWPRM